MCAFSANLLGEVCVSVGVGGRALARHYEAALPTALLGNQEALAGILFHRAQRHIALSLASPHRAVPGRGRATEIGRRRFRDKQRGSATPSEVILKIPGCPACACFALLFPCVRVAGRAEQDGTASL